MTYHDNHTRTITEPHVHPEDFGAVGDGVTDDFVALQAAIDTGKQVALASECYSISNTLEMPSGMRFGSAGTRIYTESEKPE